MTKQNKELLLTEFKKALEVANAQLQALIQQIDTTNQLIELLENHQPIENKPLKGIGKKGK